MTLSILLSDRIAQLAAEADAITREISDLTTRRADIRMVLAEFGQILDRAPLASVPGVAADIVERFERIQLHPLKRPRARKGEVQERVLGMLRDDRRGWKLYEIVARSGCRNKGVYAAVARLVMVGEIIKSGCPALYRANPHDPVLLLKPAS